MRVTFYTGLGSQRHEVWIGELDIVPRAGEEVTWDNGENARRVDRVTHWLATKDNLPLIEIYLR